MFCWRSKLTRFGPAIVRSLAAEALTGEYPILDVRPEWMQQPEEMGSKAKFWFRDPDTKGPNWLFKHPQPDTGEHWAEKLAEQVADCLKIPHARVQFARFQGKQGTATESFTSGDVGLLHGNQLLEAIVGGYEPEKRFGQSGHTLLNVMKTMDAVFGADAQQAKAKIADYLVLDALIGNTDRHHENWGLLVRFSDPLSHWEVAPSFDHASSLGREMRDERRQRLLKEGRVGWYVERGRGAVYWSEETRRGPSPLELVRCATRAHTNLFRPALARLRQFDHSKFCEFLGRVPNDWMSAPARRFAAASVSYALNELRNLE